MDSIAGILAGGFLVLLVAHAMLVRRFFKLQAALDHVRLATYNLTSMAADQIGDLEESLRDAGIELCRDRMNERFRREALSAKERHRESLERFDAACAGAYEVREKLIRQIQDGRE
jgi:hypothetical protein